MPTDEAVRPGDEQGTQYEDLKGTPPAVLVPQRLTKSKIFVAYFRLAMFQLVIRHTMKSPQIGLLAMNCQWVSLAIVGLGVRDTRNLRPREEEPERSLL